jgi:Ca2+-binding EF-hand superfamily protein
MDEVTTKLSEKDSKGEGFISTEALRRTLTDDVKIKGLTSTDIEVIIQKLDESNRGFIALNKGLEKIMELAQETKNEISLRNFALSVKRQ